MPTIATVGHSTLPLEGFLALLARGEVEHVVDVRRFPGSRRYPHFNREALQVALPAHGLRYTHLEALGGRRAGDVAAASPNGYWENTSFRAYADYAMTPAFRAGLDTLRTLARAGRCAVMCSEAVWWRCHRRIVADYLLAAGDHVLHLLPPDQMQVATATPGLQPGPHGGLVYPPPQAGLFGIPP